MKKLQRTGTQNKANQTHICAHKKNRRLNGLNEADNCDFDSKKRFKEVKRAFYPPAGNLFPRFLSGGPRSCAFQHGR